MSSNTGFTINTGGSLTGEMLKETVSFTVSPDKSKTETSK
ncbi:hypothetical protein ASZ90_003594 [hydrocarbon metagenome]|uniref:Uncharacterized protein n=1 Tax=hydrocarbon metagenome TaxID=938273 RepID=A0A0W8G0D0_9ZZZZ